MATATIAPGDLQSIRLAEEAEAMACADFYRAAPPALGVRAERVAGTTVMLAPCVPVAYFNRAIGFTGAGFIDESGLDRVIGLFDAAGVADFWIQVTPEAAPQAFLGWIAARAFVLASRPRWAKFARGTADPPEPRSALEIRPATTADAGAIARIVTDAYGLPQNLRPWVAALVGRPGWQFHVACLEGTPVGTGALFVNGGSAWLGFAATLAQHRGLGAQSALLAARIAAAARSGCTTVVTETGEPKDDEPNPSLANIRRAGFVQVCSRLNFRRVED